MKITDLILDLLTEEVTNKKLFQFLLNKWYGANPTDQQKIEAEKLLTRFQEIQNGLSTKRPQVISFLSRFDGNNGREFFNPEQLKDIRYYNLNQIKFLYYEYTDEDATNQEDVFSDTNTAPTPEKIEASKQLFSGSENAIINEGDFRVYDIKDQKMSVRYGYYVEKINKEQKRGDYPWCVTWRNDQGRTNMWGNYRSQGRSFYFVIDESRNPETDRYYLGALQRDTSVSGGFRLTSLLNDGDTVMSWSDIVNIYPKIAEHKDLISVKPYSKEELSEKNIVGQINENPGSEYEFKRMEKQLKRAYINNFGSLKTAESWKSMDESLRSLYILTTRKQDVNDRFSNFEFVNEIKKIGSDYTLLDNRLKQIELEGVGYIIDQLMKNEFKLRRTSVNNPQIRIYESKINGLCGIFHAKSGTWVKLNGITYEPLFKEVDSDIYFDSDDVGHFVEIFKKNGSDEKFYCVYPTEADNVDGYFISGKKWDELKPLLDDEPRKIDPETDVDIKETSNGV